MPNTRSTITQPGSQDIILLTGGENLVGSALLAELDTRSVMTRGGRLVGRSAMPNLASAERDIDNVGRPIQAIVHVASVCSTPGMTELTLAELDLVLKLAERRNIPIYLLSSAFPCDDRAVAAVKASRAAHVVVLTSLLVGSGRTGSGSNAGALSSFLNAAIAEQASGSDPDDRLIDLVPSDLVVEVVLGLIANSFTDGEYWLTSGELALHAGQVRDAVVAFAGERAISIDGGGQHIHSDGHWLGRAPLDTSLGDRFQHSIGELGALGVRGLPGQMELLARAIHSWERETTRPQSSAA